MKKLLNTALLLLFMANVYGQKSPIVAAELTEEYLSLLKDKRIAVLSNHTGMVGSKHLVDILVQEKVNVTSIFSPEHGFRGDADAGEHRCV